MSTTPHRLEALQGAWRVVSLEMDGRNMPAAAFDGSSIVIEGTSFTSVGMGAPYEGTIALGDATKPNAFDLVITGGHASGTTNLGIYKVEGERWTICLATRGTRRPTTFATGGRTGLALQTLERGQPPRGRRTANGKARGRVAGQAVPAVSSGVVTELEGDWTMLSGVMNGAVMDTALVEWCRRITRGDVTSVVAGPQTMLEARFTLNPSTTPKEIDYVNLLGSNKGKRQTGIYELNEGTLRICMAAPGSPRPSELASTSRDGRSFTTWRRTSSSSAKDSQRRTP